jgi:hypothetical protein
MEKNEKVFCKRRQMPNVCLSCLRKESSVLAKQEYFVVPNNPRHVIHGKEEWVCKACGAKRVISWVMQHHPLETEYEELYFNGSYYDCKREE